MAPTVTTANPGNTADASNWVPTYYANDQSGKQNTQTWIDTISRRQTGFANITAAELAEYYRDRGKTDTANMYAEIAAASKSYPVTQVSGSGYMYDAQSGTPYSVSNRYAKTPIVTRYLDSITPASTTALSPATETTPRDNLMEALKTFTTSKAEPTSINIYDDFIGVKQGAYNNAAAQIATGNILSGDVAIGAGAMAADVAFPLDLINVGNKLMTGRGDELNPSDYTFAALDALALVGGALSFGTEYVGIKGLKTAAKVASVGSKATQFAGIGVAGFGGAAIMAGGLA